MTTAVYYPDDKYAKLVATLVRIAPSAPSLGIRPSPWTWAIDDNDVKILLGEKFDIWPEAILPFVEHPLPMAVAVSRGSVAHKLQS